VESDRDRIRKGSANEREKIVKVGEGESNDLGHPVLAAFLASNTKAEQVTSII